MQLSGVVNCYLDSSNHECCLSSNIVKWKRKTCIYLSHSFHPITLCKKILIWWIHKMMDILMFSSWETFHSTKMPHHLKVMSIVAHLNNIYTQEKHLCKLTNCRRLTLLMWYYFPCAFIYYKLQKRIVNIPQSIIKSKQPISLEVFVIKIIKLEAKIIPGCVRSLHLE